MIKSKESVLLSTEKILQILALPTVGSQRAFEMIRILESMEISLAEMEEKELFDFACQLWPTRICNEHYARWRYQLDIVNQRLEKSDMAGVQTVSFFEEDYPDLLRQLKNPPMILYYQGNLERLNQDVTLAVIGTRNPLPYTIKAGIKIAEHLVAENIHIVSGLAEGCDAIGHEASVRANKATTAILAHGLQTVFPKKHQLLAESILENDGLLLSEYLWGEAPHRGLFVHRDRLQAGISQATFLLESTLSGGSIHAANAAIKYHRPLLALKMPDYFKGNASISGNQFYLDEKKAAAIADRNDVQYWIQQLKVRKNASAMSHMDSGLLSEFQQDIFDL